jgi:hypothetical protein
MFPATFKEYPEFVVPIPRFPFGIITVPSLPHAIRFLVPLECCNIIGSSCPSPPAAIKNVP